MRKVVYAIVSSVVIISTSFVKRSTAQELLWERETVDSGGSKPALVMNSKDAPIIAFMLESFSGFVKLAEKGEGQWKIETVSQGYFYGPLDVTVDSNDVPYINYHDHTTEDQTIALRSGDEWQVSNISHPGHDGWDNNIKFAPNQVLHTLTTDPSGFGGSGLEYASRIDGQWQVEEVGSGPIMYAEGTSIAFDSNSTPHISYHKGDRMLFYGIRESEGNWNLSPVDEGEETGMFSSITVTPDGHPVISYVAFNENGGADIRLASNNGAQWEIETIDTVDDLSVGFSFARNATSVRLDAQGQPHVAYTSESSIRFASKLDGDWIIETIDTIDNIEGSRFGEQVDLEMDSKGNWHLTSFDVTRSSPLSGNIFYYRRKPTNIPGWKVY